MKILHLISLLFCSLYVLQANTTFQENNQFNHKKFLKEIENSSDEIYNLRLEYYNQYLEQKPNDLYVEIERCKFIQNAQYDDNEGYNPNQQSFDSCALIIEKKYPYHPEALMFQLSYKWGEEKGKTCNAIEQSIISKNELWTKKNLGKYYSIKAMDSYYDGNNKEALSYFNQACKYDREQSKSLDYAQILFDLDKIELARTVINEHSDSSKKTWELSQKANLLLQLNEFEKALKLFNEIDSIDSSYNNNQKIAETMIGIKQYNFARTYLVTDTSISWDNETAIRKLFLHDLKYHNKDTALESYNLYRNIGFTSDPLALYRLKLFFKAPFLSWKFRDLISLFLFALLIGVILIIPSIWILPIHFVGHRWKIFNSVSDESSIWSLKDFWVISVAALIAIFLSSMVDISLINSILNRNYYDTNLPQNKIALSGLIFISLMSITGIALIIKVGFKNIIKHNQETHKLISSTVLWFIAYKVIFGIWAQIGIRYFNFSMESIAVILETLMATKLELISITNTYGKASCLLLVAFLVPIYEEVIFRGLILKSTERYLTFKYANALQAFFFACVHLNLFLFPIFFLFGIGTGKLNKKYGSLLPGIIFHIINNLLALAILFVKMKN